MLKVLYSMQILVEEVVDTQVGLPLLINTVII